MGSFGYTRIGVPTPLVQANAGLLVQRDTVTFSSNFSITSGHAGKLIAATASGLTGGLPALNSLTDAVFEIVNNSNGNLTLTCAGTDTFASGATSLVIPAGSSADLVADTLVWRSVNPVASTGLKTDSSGLLSVDTTNLTQNTSPTGNDWFLMQTAAGALQKAHSTDMSSKYPPFMIWGLNMSNNSVDSVNDIDIGAGNCRDSTNTVNMGWAGGTKRLDANFAEGTNQGMLDTGAKAGSATYHIFLILRPDTGVTDILASLSASAPTMPANYSYFRRIGSVLTTGGVANRLFVQMGNEFFLDAPVNDAQGAAVGTTRIAKALTVPTGIVVIAKFNVGFGATAAGVGLIITAIGASDQGPTGGSNNGTATVLAAGTSTTTFTSLVPTQAWTSTSGQIGVRAGAASCVYSILTTGWVDLRGQDGRL